MKHQITWRRTVIGGEPLHHDFCAYVDGNVNVARLLLEYDSDRNRVWSCNMAINGASETCLTRSEAITWIETQLDDFIAAHTDADPQEWVPDQRSIQLRSMRKNDPDEYAILVAALRSGRVERIGRKN